MPPNAALLMLDAKRRCLRKRVAPSARLLLKFLFFLRFSRFFASSPSILEEREEECVSQKKKGRRRNHFASFVLQHFVLKSAYCRLKKEKEKKEKRKKKKRREKSKVGVEIAF